MTVMRVFRHGLGSRISACVVGAVFLVLPLSGIVVRAESIAAALEAAAEESATAEDTVVPRVEFMPELSFAQSARDPSITTVDEMDAP
jgi:hypothetical protein